MLAQPNPLFGSQVLKRNTSSSPVTTPDNGKTWFVQSITVEQFDCTPVQSSATAGQAIFVAASNSRQGKVTTDNFNASSNSSLSNPSSLKQSKLPSSTKGILSGSPEASLGTTANDSCVWAQPTPRSLVTRGFQAQNKAKPGSRKRGIAERLGRLKSRSQIKHPHQHTLGRFG